MALKIRYINDPFRLARFPPQVLILAFACSLLIACGGCGLVTGKDPATQAAAGSATRLTAASWNVQALFDGVEDGTEYDDYAVASGWSDVKYRVRLERIGEVVALMVPGGPDVLALQEIENGRVLEGLAKGPLGKYGYGYTARAALPGAALGIALLSRFPLSRIRAHQASVPFGETPRPILEARVETALGPVVVFVCHWKSKLGEAERTEAVRTASAKVLVRRIAELALEDPTMDIVVLGDLNENWDEFERQGGLAPTALLPDNSRAASVVNPAGAPDSHAGNLLVLSPERPPRADCLPGAVALYSPWPASPWPGSYAYRGVWETIDHVLLNPALFDSKGWEYGSFTVLDSPILVDDDLFPETYNPRTGGGFSDHLPVVVEFKRAE